MMDQYIAAEFIQEGMNLIASCVVVGVGLSAFAMALSWAVRTVIKLLHKFF